MNVYILFGLCLCFTAPSCLAQDGAGSLSVSDLIEKIAEEFDLTLGNITLDVEEIMESLQVDNESFEEKLASVAEHLAQQDFSVSDFLSNIEVSTADGGIFEVAMKFGDIGGVRFRFSLGDEMKDQLKALKDAIFEKLNDIDSEELGAMKESFIEKLNDIYDNLVAILSEHTN